MTEKTASSPTQPGFAKRLLLAVIKLPSALLLGLLLLYFVLPYLPVYQPWPITIVGYVLPWMMIPLGIITLLVLWAGVRRLLLACGICWALFLLTYGSLFLPSRPPQAEGPHFRLVTYNVHIKGTDPAPPLAEIAVHDPDILLLQEYYNPKAAQMTEALAAIYPYQAPDFGAAIFSRYPLENCRLERIKATGISGWVQHCQALIEGRRLELFNYHARPPVLSKAPLPYLGWPMMNGYDTTTHTGDIERLMDSLETADGIRIVAGDFNMTDRQEAYTRLRQQFQDAYQERGWGFGFTFTKFPALRIPTWRIDFVFHSGELAALEAGVGSFGPSDHRPLVVDFGFK